MRIGAGRFFALALLLAACRSAGERLERAIILPSHVEAAIAAEEKFASRYDTLPAEGEPWFEVMSGTARVLVVAGHATAQTREEALKAADRGTGSLAIGIHQLTGATAIYTTRRSPSDPNFYDDNAFKLALARLIEERKPMFVLDLHASHSYRPYDVDLGTMEGRSLLGREGWLSRLARALRREGLHNLSRDYFAASRNRTVTKFASSRGVPAIQLEVSATWLNPSRDPLSAHRFAQLLQALVRFIREIDPSASAPPAD